LCIVGYTDLPSRLPTQSSTQYANNISKFLLSIATQDAPQSLTVDMTDEVVRGSIVLHNGTPIPPAPRPAPPPSPPTPSTSSSTAIAEETAKALTPFQKVSREVALVTTGMGTAVVLGKVTDPGFMEQFFTFGLAALIGYRVVWGVTPALHSPLMSVTNAISGEFYFFVFIYFVFEGE